MENSRTSAIAERASLECELHKWFSDQGVSSEGATRAVQLLDAGKLLAQPRPSRWNRRGEFGVQERCRYLWYRHAARILGWCERRKFPDIVTSILRGHVFPSQSVSDEAPGTDGKGRVTSGATFAGPIATNPDRSRAGKSYALSRATARVQGFSGRLKIFTFNEFAEVK